ncbi:hypothetical protein BOX15_Mlig017366g2 [Macrostomum lignano]|uniref:Uncharacterized protein n=1 Tax=Macrostomum lignano TaxID=282301 RepID=A0A267FME3_9PLAT|nr:hypothetical protein BOX15_Mlig017366g2 [Macrostomum lignano]
MATARKDLMQRAVKPVSLQDEFVRFCMLSSVRGVPRILRSRSLCWQAVWLVSVFGFLGISLLSITLLVNTYLSYQTVLEVTTRHYTQTVPFPSVTICNLQPFSTDMVKRFIRNPNVNVTDMRFLNELKKMKNHPNYTSSFKALNEKSFLFQNWGIETVRKIGLTFHEFVLDGTCNFSFVQAAKFQQRECNLRTDVLLIPNPQFFTCFMISPTPDIANTTYSLEMDLYLDTEQLFDCQQTTECHDALFDLDDSIGAHVLVHPAMTYPRISQLGIHVLPGTKSVIEVVETRSLEKYQQSPKETCTNKQLIDLFIGAKERTTAFPFAYESFTCRQLMVQEKILSNCGCTDPDYPLTADMKDAPFCAELKKPGQSTDAFLKNSAAWLLKFAATIAPRAWSWTPET